MPNIALMSNMNFRRRFNEINNKLNSETDNKLIISKAEIKDKPTFLYALRLFIWAYILMMAVDITVFYIVLFKRKMCDRKTNNEINNETIFSPDMTPKAPPSTPESRSEAKTPPWAPKKMKLPKSREQYHRPVTRSMTNESRRLRKRGLNLFG